MIVFISKIGHSFKLVLKNNFCNIKGALQNESSNNILLVFFYTTFQSVSGLASKEHSEF